MTVHDVSLNTDISNWEILRYFFNLWLLKYLSHQLGPFFTSWHFMCLANLVVKSNLTTRVEIWARWNLFIKRGFLKNAFFVYWNHLQLLPLSYMKNSMIVSFMMLYYWFLLLLLLLLLSLSFFYIITTIDNDCQARITNN